MKAKYKKLKFNMNKKILSALVVVLVIAVLGGLIAYRYTHNKAGTTQADSSAKNTTLATSTFETYDKNGVLVNQILAKNYHFTVIKRGPFSGLVGLHCYDKNPLDASSGKIGYVLCDINFINDKIGGYFSIMWRDTTKDINLLQDAVLQDLLKSKNSAVTLKNPSLYSEKSFTCKGDTTFKEKVTGMNGRFVDCSLTPKNEDLPIYVTFFYFSADKNVLVFSNIGVTKKTNQIEFIKSTRERLQFITKTNASTVSVLKNITDVVSISILKNIEFSFIEHAYAQESEDGGGNGVSNGGGFGSDGGGNTSTGNGQSSIGGFFSAIGSFFSGLASSFGSSPVQSAVTLAAFGTGQYYNGSILPGSSAAVSGMTSVGYGTYCCNAAGQAISVSGGNGGGAGGGAASGPGGSFVIINPTVNPRCALPPVYCTIGQTVQGTNPFSWSCTTKNNQDNCTIVYVPPPPPPVNGVAGTDPWQCIVGNRSAQSTSGNVWTWTCDGLNGGSPGQGTAYMTGALNVSPSSCSIATGQSTCPVTFSWNTVNPIGTSQVVGDGGGPYSTVTNSSNESLSVKYGGNTFRLMNNGVELDNKSVSATCAAGGYDTIGGVCADPQVPSISIVGQYYSTGTLSFTCSGSNHYSVDLNGSSYIPVTPYTGPVTINNISTAGAYLVKCRHGSVSSQAVRPYASVPPAAVVSLSVSPATLSKQDDVTVNWSTVFPTNACTLTAKVVCANNKCTAAQIAAENSLNTVLTTSKTDANDKSGSRLVTTAIRKVAPGHKDNDSPIIVTDWKALGKKTLHILYTTDLTYECSPTSKETKRIQVTKSVDQ